MMIERPLPRLSAMKTIAMMGCAVIVPGSVGIVAVHYQSRVLVAISALVMIATITGLWYLYFHRRRCPKCGWLLAFRGDLTGDSRQSRALLDCSACQITWDTGETFEDDDAA
jgi:hypothetical protein